MTRWAHLLFNMLVLVCLAQTADAEFVLRPPRERPIASSSVPPF
jgi:hypothetical protein